MLRFLVGAAAFVIVVAGMRAATTIVVPLLFAISTNLRLHYEICDEHPLS